jgi:16S rRNA (cytidine1402-2'-O)-methyltransferase
MSLTLIPTPLKEELPLEPTALALLQTAASDERYWILVEELKVARQRWLRWGLPRETIERFKAFNEHSVEVLEGEVVKHLKSGGLAVLMSDGGLPAFCDPGQSLVNRCHQNKIPVTATSFPNSISLAVALSGFSHRSFFFRGFLPQKEGRESALKEVWAHSATQVLMETPYRRQRLLEELLQHRPGPQKKRRVFIALELNGPQELLVQGELETVAARVASIEKQEFVLILEAIS